MVKFFAGKGTIQQPYLRLMGKKLLACALSGFVSTNAGGDFHPGVENRFLTSRRPADTAHASSMA